MTIDQRATPLASEKLDTKLMDFVNKCAIQQCLRGGANEVTKQLNHGKSGLVILASDVTPLEILLHLVILCEDKNVPYVFVRSQEAMGHAIGLTKPCIAVSITKSPVVEQELERMILLVEGI